MQQRLKKRWKLYYASMTTTSNMHEIFDRFHSNEILQKKEAIHELKIRVDEEINQHPLSLQENEITELLLFLIPLLKEDLFRSDVLIIFTSLPLSLFSDHIIDLCLQSNLLQQFHTILEHSDDEIERQYNIYHFLFKFIQLNNNLIQEIINENFLRLFSERLSNFLNKEHSDETLLILFLPSIEQEILNIIGVIGSEGAYYHLFALVNQGLYSLLVQLLLHPRCDQENALKIVKVLKQMVAIAVRSQQQDHGMFLTMLTNLGILGTLHTLRSKSFDNAELLEMIQETLDISSFGASVNMKSLYSRK
eukprot:gene14679-16293_t